MMLFLAIVATLGTIIATLLVTFANGMSDAPTERGVSYWGSLLGIVCSAGLWLCWWYGVHPSW